MENNENIKTLPLAFAAIDQYVTTNIVEAVETEVKGKDMVECGKGNMYPQYVHGLFEDAPTLRSVILGTVDFIGGDNIICNIPDFSMAMNDRGDTIEDIIRQFAQDYLVEGYAALNIIRDLAGNISQIYNIDAKRIRSNKTNSLFYYSEDYDKKSSGRVRALTYPAFNSKENQPSSILFIKNEKYRTYGLPIWAGAVKYAEIEKMIGEYHLNNLQNGFASPYIINLNNGQPTDEVREEIEDGFSEKFCGYQNAGRPVISFNVDKEHAAEIVSIPGDNFADKYNALDKAAKQAIFTSFRSHPSLFGIPTEGSALNKEDYDQVFKLFNKTMVLPVQKVIKRAFEKIFGVKEVITIEPFSVEWSKDNNEEENVA